MTVATRKLILRANAIWLMLGALGGLAGDLRGAFFGLGPVGLVLRSAPDAAIGMVEAHGLALICSLLLWRAAPVRAWHLTAVAVHVLLGTANLVFWQMFVRADILPVGYVTTALHVLFALLQLWAALAVAPDNSPLIEFSGRRSIEPGDGGAR